MIREFLQRPQANLLPFPMRPLAFVLLGLCLSGCGNGIEKESVADNSNGQETSDDGKSKESKKSTPKETESTPKDTTKSAEVTVTIQSWDDTVKTIAKFKGKVVVLDLWSTSCEPCMKEFPHLVQLHKKHDKSKLVCMSVSCDYDGIPGEPPESRTEDVLAFLKKSNATFTNILLNVESEKVFEMLNLASIPAVYVYGTDGKLKKRFDYESGEEFTYEKDIIPFVENLLK